MRLFEEVTSDELRDIFAQTSFLVTRVEAWLSNAHGDVAVARYAKMARRRLVAPMNGADGGDGAHVANGGEAYDLTAAEETMEENHADGASGADGDGVAAGGSTALWCDVAPAGLEGHGDAAFPNMEEFFSGVFLVFGFEE